MKGNGKVSAHGKYLIALQFYKKGKAFIAAAILLDRQNPADEAFSYVFLHLLCQGVEVTLKGNLLLKDYNKFQPQLKNIGHDLLKCAETARECFNLNRQSQNLNEELLELSRFFKNHQLRYAGLLDLFIDPKTIDRKMTLKRILAVVRLTEKHLKLR